MEHSKNYEKVKKNYDMGFWSLNMVKNAVLKNWITQDEYYEITGDIYTS